MGYWEYLDLGHLKTIRFHLISITQCLTQHMHKFKSMGHKTDKTRTEDLSTDQRAHRHPNKSADYTEEAQNVRNDDIGQVDRLEEGKVDHARNKASGNRTES